ncbi:MAG: hypothetical protein KGH60_03160 [Candidatus Micrarchaeota archaeon]|nr:hypothetical protein [Candidatus Micrarchaeota archaeon]
MTIDKSSKIAVILVVLIATAGLSVQTNLLLQQAGYLKLSVGAFVLPITLMYLVNIVFAFFWIKFILERRYTAFVKVLAAQVAIAVLLVWMFSVVYI